MDTNKIIENSRDMLSVMSLEKILPFTCIDKDSCLIKYKISAKNSDYKETPYYYKGKKLLHFTSLSSLCEILNSNSLRLYTLNNCNDTLELEYWKNLYSSSDFDFYKNDHILSASFTMPDKYNDFMMWRLYGDKGNGVCIEFTIENKQEDWHKFLLTPIQYQKDDSLINSYFEALCEFEKKYKYKVDFSLSPIIPFFKSSEWEQEHEIRLIYYNDDLIEDYSIKRLEIEKQQKKIYYTPFPLNHYSKYEEFTIKDKDRIPNLRISKIYTGFDRSDIRFYRLYELISDYKKNTLKQPEREIDIEALGIQGKIR